MQSDRVFFPNLDGFRFLSFFFVFLVHSGYTEYLEIKHSFQYKLIKGFFSYGTLGLTFFFVLSGFLITYLLCVEESKKGKINILAFYLRRTLRIWPLYFFCVIFGFIIFPTIKTALGQVSTETANPWLFVTFLSNFNNITNGQPDAGILAVLWSVAIEEQFYLIWPLLFVIFKEKRFWLFISLILISIIFRFLYYNHFTLIFHHTLSYIGDMALGGFTGWLIFKYSKIRSYFINLSKNTIICFYLLSFIILGLKPYLVDNMYFVGLREIFFSSVFAFIILEQNFSNNSFYKIGHNQFLSYWGKYTYGLYCLHFIIILIITNGFKFLKLDNSIITVLFFVPLISFLIALLVSWISFNYFEKHFLKLKDRFAF